MALEITFVNHMEATAFVETEEEANLVEAHFKKYVPGSEWINKARGLSGGFHYRFWDKRFGKIGRGLVPELKRWCKEKGIPYYFDRNGYAKGDDVTPEQMLEWSKTVVNPAKFTMRDDQATALAMCIKRKNLIVEAITGFGKSMIIYGVIRYIIENSERNILLIVPNKQLVSQMQTDFKDYGWDKVEDFVEMQHSELEKPTFSKRVLLTTWQSIQKNAPGFFERYGALIVDEVHRVKGDTNKVSQLTNIIKRCYRADFRLGFTGTMPDEPYFAYMVMQYLGAVYKPVSYSDLKEMGVLSDCLVKTVQLDYDAEDRKKWHHRGYQDEVRFIEENPNRSQAILGIMKDFPKEENTLVMFSHTKHLDNMLDYFLNNGFDDIRVIKGETKVKAREKVRETAEGETGVVIFATYGCVQEGVNIKKLHNVVLASSSKSEIRVLQTIGRGLRIHKEKEKVVIWDIVDDLSHKKSRNHTLKHAVERFSYYEEQGYALERVNVPVAPSVTFAEDLD